MDDGLRSLSDIELRRELWMWRAFGLLLVLLNIFVTISTYVTDKQQHALDNADRAKNWQLINNNIDINRNKIENLTRHLDKCMGCHSFNKGVVSKK